MEPQTKLIKVGGAGRAEPLGPGIDIVLVHGLTAPNLGPISNQSIANLARLIPKNSQLYQYNLDYALDEQFRWNEVSTGSSALLQAIHETFGPPTKQVKGRYVVYVCHSLAGIVLKHTLWRASEQNRLRYCLDMTGGIVFLATPHITVSDEAAIRELCLLLRGDSTPDRKSLPRKHDVSSLAFSSLRFEELKLQCAVLSAYQTVETPAKKRLGISRKSTVVGAALAKTNLPYERLVGIDTELARIFDSYDCIIHQHLTSFFRQTLDNAVARFGTSAPTSEIERLGLGPSSTLTTPIRLANPTIEETRLNKRSSHDSPSVMVSGNSKSSPRSVERSSSNQSSSQNSSSPVSVNTEGSYNVISFRSEGPCVSVPWSYPRSLAGRNADFQGRSEVLAKIDRVLLPKHVQLDNPRPATFILVGPGGIGKSQIALQYLHNRRHQYDVVMWIRANSTESLFTDFAQISLQLNLESKENALDPVVSRELVKGWLTDPWINHTTHQGPMATWLLIFDNADSPDILHDFWPQDGQGSVLITTRDPLTRSDLYFGDSGEDLDVLPESDAVSLFRQLMHHRDKDNSDHETMVKLARRLDCYPLALVQMAGIMRRRGLTPAKFLEFYKKETTHTEYHSLRFGKQHGYMSTLASVWDLSELSVGAARLLCVIALLDPHRIDAEILTARPERSRLAGYPMNGESYSRDVTELVQSSTVRRSELYESNELSIHPLVQEVIRAQLLRSGDVDITAAFAAAAGLLSGVWPYVTTPQMGYPAYDRVDRWNQCDLIVPHISHLEKIFDSLPRETKTKCVNLDYLWLLAEAAWYYQERSNAAECLKFVQATFTAHDYYPEDLPDLLAETHGTAGIMCLEINRPDEALHHLQDHLEIREETFSQTKQVTAKLAAAYSETARAMMLNGLFTKAKVMLEKSIELRKQMPKFTNLQLFNPIMHLALCHWHNGENDQAAELLLDALREREIAFGKNDREGKRTGQLLYHLGSVRWSQGSLQESFQYHQRALYQFRATIGDMHYQTAAACYKVALHLIRMGDLNAAWKTLRQAEAVFSRGTDYAPDLARVQYRMGRVLTEQGDRNSAGLMLLKAADARLALVGDTRSPNELTDADFDELVAFWVR